MATLYMDYTGPDVQYFFDLNKNRLATRNAQNFINRLGRDNLNTLGDVSLLDIFLSKGRVVEPHYHQNAAELVYCIAGEAVVSLINPFNNQVSNIPIKPGQVANVPQGWWHWEIASEDNTHLLAIFDAPYPEYIFGSDILTKTPIEVLSHTYCLDPELLKTTLKPLNNETIIIGPTDECVAQAQHKHKPQPNVSNASMHANMNANANANTNASMNAGTNTNMNMAPGMNRYPGSAPQYTYPPQYRYPYGNRPRY